MRFTLVAIGVGFLLAPFFGGRLRNLSGRTMRLWFLLPLGLALQLAAIESRGDTWPFLLVLGSYALLFTFAVVNLPLTGMWLVVLGLVLNALAIGLNHGMPVGHKAQRHAGENPAVFAALHHDQRSSDRLLIIGNVIPVAPLNEIVSFGDIIGGVGVVDVIIHLMRPPKRRRDDDETDDDDFFKSLADVPVSTS